MKIILSFLLSIGLSVLVFGQKENIYEQDSLILLDDLVITGQGAEISKRRLSHNVATINSKTIEKLPSKRIDVLLSSQLPNSQINLTGGQAGATSIIRGRGVTSAFTNSTPIIYVDGVRMDNLNTSSVLGSGSSQSAAMSSLADIPTENIERIEYINGGAATTLYGSDAANGVIQIFTKRKSKVTTYILKSELGIETPTADFLFFKKTKDLLMTNGFYQNYNLAISGGNKKVGYSVSAGAMNSGGTQIFRNNNQNKIQFSTGFQAELSKLLKYESSFHYTNNEFARNRNGNKGGFTALWFAESGASRVIGPGFNNKLDQQTPEEYAAMKIFVDNAERLQNNQINVNRFTTSQIFKIAPSKNIRLKLMGGIDYRNQLDKNVTTNEYLSATTKGIVTDKGRIDNFTRNYLGYTFEINGQHKYYLENYSFITTIGGQLFSNQDRQVQYSGLNLRDGALTIKDAAVKISDEYLSKVLNMGFYIQENIGLYNRLFLDLGLRTDYNQAFGEDIGMQYYPKFGAAYNFEKDLLGTDYISLNRIRANYGVSGNLPPAFSNQRTMEFSGFLGEQAAFFGQTGNKLLKPEKTSTIEGGIDFSVFKDFAQFSIGYYHAKTRDALFYVPNIASSGLTKNQLYNVGEILNKGWEISAKFTPIKTENSRLDLSVSYNTLYNEVLSTGGAAAFNLNGFSSRTIQTVVQEGYPIGFIRGSKGIFKDGVWVGKESLAFLGSTLPKNFGSINLNFSYKNFSLFSTANYQTGAYANNWDAQFRFLYGADIGNVPKAEVEAHKNANWLNMTDLFIEKTDFLKVRHIGVSYKFDSLEYRFIKSLELGFMALNPINIASSSFDPENTLSGAARGQNSASTGGISYATYSNPRSFIGTIKIIL